MATTSRQALMQQPYASNSGNDAMRPSTRLLWITFCQHHGIRLSGPRLGRPKKDPEMVAAEKQQFVDDQRQRNAVEGKIGQGKRRYGLGLIREMLAATQGSSIAMNILVMNLQKLLELLFVFFVFLWELLVSTLGLQRANKVGLSYQLTGARGSHSDYTAHPVLLLFLWGSLSQEALHVLHPRLAPSSRNQGIRMKCWLASFSVL